MFLLYKNSAMISVQKRLTASMLRTHSFRKGCATYCQSFKGGPSTLAVFNRAGWSLSNVQLRYIFPTDADDQLLGRVACDMPWGDTKCGELSPHFSSRAEITDADWENLGPGYQNYPDCFKSCIPLF